MLNLLYKITDGDFTKPLPELKMYDNDTVSLTVDFTGTGFETYIKRLEFVNSAGVSSFVELGTDVSVTHILTSAQTAKGSGKLEINPIARLDTGERKGFKCLSIKLGGQMGILANLATLITDVMVEVTKRIHIKPITVNTVSPSTPASVSITQADDGLSYEFDIPKGADGYTPVKGTDYFDGAVGATGLSAYEVWLSQGHVGTQAQYLASLVGGTGATGANGTNGINGEVTNASLATTLASYALKAQEAWITPTLLNSWVLLNAAIPVQYRKDQFGKVTLKGIVKSGTIGSGTPIFTLPVGYRPPNDFYASTLSNSLFGQIYISTAGNVCALTGSTANFGLYNIEFYVS